MGCVTTAQTIKYGVVGADVLLRDLRTWDTLYIAGRLHKPVLHLRRDAELTAAAEANVASALAAGLLLLPGRFSTEVRLRRAAQRCGVCCSQPSLQCLAAMIWLASSQCRDCRCRAVFIGASSLGRKLHEVHFHGRLEPFLA